MRMILKAGRSVKTSLAKYWSFPQDSIGNNARRITSTIADCYFARCYEYFDSCGADVVHVLTPDLSALTMINAGYTAGLPVLYQELGIPYHPPGYESYYDHFARVLPLCSEVAALSPRLVNVCRSISHFPRSVSIIPITSEDLSNGYTFQRRPSEHVTFGFAARIEILKGAHDLIEAFAAAAQNGTPSRLQIAGAGSQKRRLAARTRELGISRQCDFIGTYLTPDQRSAFMQSLDALVLPSLTEGTPNSIIEAMAHGLPVVASATGGIPDVVTEETGLLVPPGNRDALAEALIVLATNPALRARMGRAARARYEQFWSPRAVIPVLLRAYERIRRPGSSASGISAR
jgi:glycosyltransferase involved in cell wall biosynthesis